MATAQLAEITEAHLNAAAQKAVQSKAAEDAAQQQLWAAQKHVADCKVATAECKAAHLKLVSDFYDQSPPAVDVVG